MLLADGVRSCFTGAAAGLAFPGSGNCQIHPLSAGLNDLGSELWGPMLQVVSIDGQYPVIAVEPAVLRCQPPF